MTLEVLQLVSSTNAPLNPRPHEQGWPKQNGNTRRLNVNPTSRATPGGAFAIDLKMHLGYLSAFKVHGISIPIIRLTVVLSLK